MHSRYFLFLQGPHGPFFSQLAGALTRAGTQVHRVGINRGDAHFWGHSGQYTPFTGSIEEWRDWLVAFLARTPVTDIVLYGDTRELHQIARDEAVKRGLTVHCFEEGYLRPFWLTYERGGTNGHSRAMKMSIADMAKALGDTRQEHREAPAHWGTLWHHIYFGAIYHFFVMALNQRYSLYRPHRCISVGRELGLHLRRLLVFPFQGLQRRIRTRRLRRSGAAYHLVLLQLAHDAAFRSHSDFSDIGSFIGMVCKEFAAGAPPHHRLVFKTHPLEDNREPLGPILRRATKAHGLTGRVHLMRGGKLGPLLDRARTAITVNSTSGQQALWRGLPLRAFGRAIYSKPELVSTQPLPEFFVSPTFPDDTAYRVFRQYLLETSQFPGGFYTSLGRAEAIRNIIDVMLSALDPYAIDGNVLAIKNDASNKAQAGVSSAPNTAKEVNIGPGR